MLFVAQFIFFAVVIAITVAIYKSFKEPKITPKKAIVESVLLANEDLLTIRNNTRNLIKDIFNTNTQNTPNLVPQNKDIENKKQSIGRILASVEVNLNGYKTLDAYKRFYNLTIAAIAAIRLSVSNVSEAQLGATLINPIMSQLKEIEELTQAKEMSIDVEDNDHHTAEGVDKQVKKIIKHINSAKESIDLLNLQVAELKEITEKIKDKLNQIENEYTELHEALLTGRYNIYRLKRPRISKFLSNFDGENYTKIAVSVFSDALEDQLINELRTHLYN